MQATMDPTLMPRAQLEAEVIVLRRRDTVRGFQESALKRIVDIATQATETARGSLTRHGYALFTRKVVELSTRLINAVVNISEVAKDGVVDAARAMYRIAIDIANFIYDNFEMIISYSAMAVAACYVVGGIVVLGAAALVAVGILPAMPTGINWDLRDIGDWC